MPVLDDIQVYEKRRVLYVVFSLLFLLLFYRLYELQLIYRDVYGQQAQENSIRVIPKEPIRGYMYDRNNRLVVDNRASFTVTVMPYEFDRKKIPFLASLINLSPEEIKAAIDRGAMYNRFIPAKVKRDVDQKTVAALEENRDKLPGVDYQIESTRTYTTPAHASHILGYTKEISEWQLSRSDPEEYAQGDVVGSSGVEAKYETAIRGKKGAEYSTVNVRGQIVGSFDQGTKNKPAIDGSDLYLTMDFALQALAESLFADKRGALVAIDPRDGGILAFVSKPDYNLSLLSGVTPKAVWRDLNSNESRPLFNRATLTRYPPGSTFKMILALAALEKGIITPDWTIQCGGAFPFGNKVFKDLHVHGSVDLRKAIQVSCNVYFYRLMLMVGLDTWSHYASEFGFGKQTGLDIIEESPGLLPTTSYMNKRYGERGWTRGFLVSLGIGQGELGVTPVQMACYAMALANRGTYYQPHTVAAFLDRSTDSLKLNPYSSRKITLTDNTWDVVREGMRRVVEEPGGTARSARIKGFQSGGKTGTAQNPHGEDHAWYVGFAPFENPTIAIAVLVENAGYGGAVAAPIAGLCIEKHLYGRLIRFDGKQPTAPIVADGAMTSPITSVERATRGAKQ
ncbi:MAG: penicillin-binding protein 2 [Ignavibacteriae bacterium]|nr:penicillin-binding protein 2 [Ignavibacteriota bacterium]